MITCQQSIPQQTNIIRLIKERPIQPHQFFGICLNNESFKQLRINLAYIFFLRNSFNNECGYEMGENEIVYLYELLFKNQAIIIPDAPLIESQSMLLSFVESEHYLLGVSNDDLRTFVVNDRKEYLSEDFELMKVHILSNLSLYHPWSALRPNTSAEDWAFEKNRIEKLKPTITALIN